MNTIAQAGPKVTRRERLSLAVLALPCLLYSMDLTVLNPAVPKLSAALQPSSAQLLWIVDIYGFVMAGALIPMAVYERSGRAAQGGEEPRVAPRPSAEMATSTHGTFAPLEIQQPYHARP